MEYNIGDIIKIGNTEKAEYFIITDFEKDWYQLALIYPVSELVTAIRTFSNNFKCVAKYNTKDFEVVMSFINKERLKMNIHGESSYMNMVKHNLNSKERIIQRISQVDESIIEERVEIDIERITNIDDGLDLMNHFSFLADVLEQAEYLEVVELIKERLIELK